MAALDPAVVALAGSRLDVERLVLDGLNAQLVGVHCSADPTVRMPLPFISVAAVSSSPPAGPAGIEVAEHVVTLQAVAGRKPDAQTIAAAAVQAAMALPRRGAVSSEFGRVASVRVTSSPSCIPEDHADGVWRYATTLRITTRP